MTKHSHEDYLNWLDAEIGKRKYLFATIESRSPQVPEVLAEHHDIGVASLLALRAELVRHRENKHGLCLQRDDQLSWENLAYLCPTCTDVTDALDEVMG